MAKLMVYHVEIGSLNFSHASESEGTTHEVSSNITNSRLGYSKKQVEVLTFS